MTSDFEEDLCPFFFSDLDLFACKKSGLRDLTRSKAPEASISAALSRDAALFERTAPCTYCVRPTFRKDPADAEKVLSAAREKVHIFENGFLAGEDVDDVERDEDSECDVAEGPEADDLSTPSTTNKNTVQEMAKGSHAHSLTFLNWKRQGKE